MIQVIPIVTTIKYELVRFFKTSKAYLLLLSGTLPIIIFLAVTAQNFAVNRLIYDPNQVKNSLIIGYVFYSYITLIFFSILISGYLISSEHAYEFLLVHISRSNLLMSKIAILIILDALLIVESTLSFYLVLLSYNITIIPLEQIILATTILLFLSIFVLSITILSNMFTIRFNLASSFANYLSIFIFFVIPFIIYFSYFDLGLVDQRILDLSLHKLVQDTVFFIILDSKQITLATYGADVWFLIISSSLSYILSFLLFVTSSITN